MTHIRQPVIKPLSKEFIQPEGYPDTTTVNQRVGAAVARLQVRGAVNLPMNPLETAWQLEALVRVLFAKGLVDQPDVDNIAYFTAYLQMQFLERIVDAKPQSPLVVPSVIARNAS